MGEAPSCLLCETPAGVRALYRLEGLEVLRCARCRLTFLDPSTQPEQPEDLYAEDYFQERKRYFFVDPSAAEQHPYIEANLREFSDALPMLEALGTPGRRLLDVGCGVGVFLTIARDRGWQVTGIDISEFASRYARDTFHVDARRGTLGSLDLEPASFDVVTMWDFIEHVPDPIAELRQARRVLVEGGHVLLNTPNQDGLLRALADVCYKLSFGRFDYPVRKLYHIYHLYYFSPATIREVCERAGFEVVELARTPIPLAKARGSDFEKSVVRAFSSLESALGREYQLLVVARKK